MTDPIDRDAIRARADAATPGPWEDRNDDLIAFTPGRAGYRTICSGAWTMADAEFIAHARTDIPLLLDALAAAEAERDEYKAGCRAAMDEARRLLAMHSYKPPHTTAPDSARAEVELMRPIVEAAKAYVQNWRDLDRYTGDGRDLNRLADAAHLGRADLVAAVDTFTEASVVEDR